MAHPFFVHRHRFSMRTFIDRLHQTSVFFQPRDSHSSHFFTPLLCSPDHHVTICRPTLSIFFLEHLSREPSSASRTPSITLLSVETFFTAVESSVLSSIRPFNTLGATVHTFICICISYHASRTIVYPLSWRTDYAIICNFFTF